MPLLLKKSYYEILEPRSIPEISSFYKKVKFNF